DPVSGSNVVAGQDIKYTLSFSNTGNGAGEVAYFDDLRQVVDKGALSGLAADAPLVATMVGSDGFSVTGTLAAGETKTVTYSVKVNADVVGGVFVNNFVVPGTTPPVDPPEVCDPVTQLCTTHPVKVPGFTVAKAADPVSGTNVAAGQTITYTVTGSNTGNTTLDPVVLTDDLSKVLDNAVLVDGSLKASVDGVDGAAPTLSGTTLSWTGVLEAGKSVVLTYQVKVNAGVAGGTLINNKVTGTAKPPTGPEITPPPVTTEHPVLSPKIAVVKSSDPVSGSNVVAGQDIKYTLTFTNTGNGAGEVAYFDDLRQVVDKGALSGLTADAPLVATMVGTDGFSVTGTLAAGETKTVTYSVKVNADVVGGVFVNNFVVPGTTPPVDPPEVCDPVTQLCTTHPVKVPGFTVAKAADPVSGTNVAAGQTITYTVTGSNTGNTTLDPVVLTDDLSKVLDNATLVDGSLKATVDGVDGAAPTLSSSTLSWTGVLEAGKSVVLTYQVKINDGVAGGVLINNKVTGTAKPPTGPEITPPPVTTEHPVVSPKIAVVKSSDPVSGSNIVAGQDIKYTLTFTNTGNGAGEVAHFDDLRGLLDDADLVAGSLSADAPLTAAMVGTDGFSVTGTLAAGESKTVTYTVTVKADADRVAANADNTVLNFVVPGTTPPVDPPEVCDPVTQLCTTHPVKVPGFTVAKAADPVSGTNVAAGQTITYTVTGSNTGNTTLDPVVLTDDLSKVLDNATLVDGSLKATVDSVDGAAPTLSGTTLSWTGVLEAGKSVVLTYQVKINDGVAGGVLINNKVTGTAKPPTGPEITPPPVTTEHPVDGTPAIEVLKSSVPSTTNRVVGGQEITYTLTFKNVGTADGEVSFYDDLTDVLDDAVMTKDPATTSTLVVSGVVDNVFTVTGKLAKGETATVTYTVKVNPEIGTLSGPGFTPGVLNNYLVVGGENPPVDCVPGDALCTEHPIDPPETTTTVPPTTTTTPPVTTEPCVPPTTTTRMVPTTTVATTTASAITAGDADVTGTEESTTAEETTTEETTTEEFVAEEIVDPCGVTTTTPPTTTPPVTTVPPTTTVPNTTVPVTPTIIIPPIVVVPPIVVPPTVPGQPVPSTVPGQPKPPTANPGQPGQPKPSAPQGGTINSGGGAGESGVNTGLLAAGGLVLLLALGTGVVLLTRKRREDGDN
ncbi:isopeptide-forming domain-containing fimbrial protein, partial [Rhodococcus qingshengii]|uniref:isopeptide-forming domain-containing fimbrial protein n=1 Tax=Rhodococcus qingshengii TaxID=334542 RepID=UPI0022B3CEA9